MRKPVVHLYTLCWDEADMLGFFFRHYDPWVDRYVVFDDGSTDRSLDILRAHPKVEVRRFTRSNPNSFVISHAAMQDEVWKESRGKADWVVITAIDEHLWIPGMRVQTYLTRQQRRGVTFIPALGFDMISHTMPDDKGLLVDRVTRGKPSIMFNKLSIFNPDAVEQTNFGMGRHHAEPTGHLRLPERDELLLWHYKRLGRDRTALRERTQGARLGSTDIANQWGFQYLWSREKFDQEWDAFDRSSIELDKKNPGRLNNERRWWSVYGSDIRVKPRRFDLFEKLRSIAGR